MSGILLPLTFPCGHATRRFRTPDNRYPYEDPRVSLQGNVGRCIPNERTPTMRFLNALRLGLLITMRSAYEINARVALICIAYDSYLVFYCSCPMFTLRLVSIRLAFIFIVDRYNYPCGKTRDKIWNYRIMIYAFRHCIMR